MANNLSLRPSYWASVSGGKDSLYMLTLILHNPDKYPLDGVVHFELEIDYPFIKDVVDFMEAECKKIGVPFVRIKPRKSWEELYYRINSKTNNIYGYPTKKVRWCNSKYKLDAQSQLNEFLNAKGYYLVRYIGYCADEKKRFEKRNHTQTERYPLVEEKVIESDILEWAKTQPIFNHYYETNKRCGCMYCPLSNYITYAYLYKYYPNNFEYMIEKMKETEKIITGKTGRPFSVICGYPKYNAEYLENIIKTKWIKKLEELEKEKK